MASIVDQVPGRIEELTNKIITLEESVNSFNEEDIVSQRETRARGYAKIIVDAIKDMLVDAKIYVESKHPTQPEYRYEQNSKSEKKCGIDVGG